MGTNRRYAHRIDQQMAVRAQEVASAPRAIGLSAVEVDLASRPARSHDAPVAVRTWVHLAPTPIQLEGVAVEWNDAAVHVELVDGDGRTYRVWVWASAVERVDSPLERTERR